MTTLTSTVEDSYAEVEDVTREIRELQCRFPRLVTDEFGKTIAEFPCKSAFIFTCPSCALRQRADRYTLALDGIEGHDPSRFCFLTLTPPPEASKSDDAIREWNSLIVVLFVNLLANIRRNVGGCEYIRAVEFQCEKDRAGLAHLHVLLRFKRAVTTEVREEIWDIITRTTTRGSSHRWGFGAGPEEKRVREKFIAASVQSFESTEQVTAALGYTLKNAIYRAADQMGFARFSELTRPEDHVWGGNSGAGFRGRLVSWSSAWCTVTLRAIREERRLASDLPSLPKVSERHFGWVREDFGGAEVSMIAMEYAHVLLAHVRNRRNAAVLE